MSYVLGIDLGTSYFKAAVFDECGSIQALARRATPVQRTQPNHSEINPTVFQQILIELLHDLRDQDVQAYTKIRAASFASQANSFVLLDDADQPITPIILWDDRRAIDMRDQLDALPLGPTFYPVTGVSGLSGLALPVKWLWLKEHEPTVVGQAHRLCMISDLFTHWLTGQHVTEAGIAALTGLVDIHQLKWRMDAVHALGIDHIQLPEVVRAGTDIGVIDGTVAQMLGLPKTCRFVVGCLDQYAGAIGAGNIQPSGVSETTGTVLATVRLADHFASNPRSGVIQGSAFHAGWYFQMSVGNVSANMLEAYRQAHAPNEDFPELVDGEAAAVPAGCDGLSLDRAASEAQGMPVFRGEKPAHTRGHYVRAILEAVADALAEQVDILCGKDRPKQIAATGGAARSFLWRQIKSDRLGIPVVATDCEEPTCLGAARLAMMAQYVNNKP